jgi:hypothetical protein
MKSIVPRFVTMRTADSESGSENLSASPTEAFPPAVSVCVPIVVAETGAPGARITRSCSVLLAVHPFAKVADMGQLNAPVTVGVPVIAPVELLKVRPVGKPVILHELRGDPVVTTA